jgi:NAD(P)-dependent dehydrogenase (short-subunit alcohol dehydrogenase family)
MAFPIPKGISTYHTSAYAAIDVTRPELSAAGKTVFITGGGTGLGLAFAQHFAKAGCTSIAITGRRQNVINDAKASLEKDFPGLKVLALQSDVTNKQAVEKSLKEVKDTFGPINVLINNAGYLPAYTPISSSSPDEWWTAFETNVRGTYNVLSSFPGVAAPDAVVINVTSGAVNALIPWMSAYSASKMAASRLCESFATENPGLRVVNIAPGVVLTDMHQKTVTHFEKVGAPQLPLDESKSVPLYASHVIANYFPVELPASFMVWAASHEADFIRNKFVWVNWDVEELKEVIENAEDKQIFTLAVNGMPNVSL